MEPIPVAMLS